MIKCNSCGYELEDGSKFCENCGKPISNDILCPGCNMKVAADDAFCANCGFALKQLVAETTPPRAIEETAIVEDTASIEPVTTDKSVEPAASAEPAIPEAPVAPVVPVAPIENVAPINSAMPINNFAPANNATVVPKAPRKKKKFLLIGLPIIAVILVAAVVLSSIFIFGKKSKINYALYIKDGELCYASLKNPEPWEVTSNLFDDIDEADEYLRRNPWCTDDGKTIFFIDNITYNDEGSTEYDLYYRSAKNPDKEAVEIDSGIRSYWVSVKGDYVTYIKDDNLYQHDLKDKTKIDSDVSDLVLSEDGSTVVYTKREDKKDGEEGEDTYELCYWQRGKDSEEIDDGIYRIDGVTEDVKDVFYTKEDTLYKNTLGKDSQKISDNVEDLVSVYPSGEVYYLKTENKLSIKDFIDDDMADADAKAEKPIEPTRAPYPEAPSSSDYEKIEYGYYYNYTTTDWDAYYAARDVWEAECDRIDAEYSAKYSEYEEKLDDYYEIEDREELRERIDEAEDTALLAKLCYYDGKKEHSLTEEVICLDYDYNRSFDVPVMTFKACEGIDDCKIKLSDIGTGAAVHEIRNNIRVKLAENRKNMLAFEDTVSSIDIENIFYATFSQDGKTIYFSSYEEEDKGDYDEDDYEEDYDVSIYDLYKMTVSGGKADKPKLFDDDVNDVTLLSNDKVIYTKNRDKEDETCDLYVDGEKIDSDVCSYAMGEILETGKLIYFTDYDEEDACGTLKIFDGKKSIEIDDDVYDVSVIPNGDLVYLRDYSKKSKEGDLYSYRNKKTEEIDTDVTSIVDINSTKAMYEYGYLTW